VANGLVPIVLSTSETDCDVFNVRCVDASGDEWIYQEFSVYTAAQTFDTTDGVADGIATALATVDGIVDDILADTNELQGDWTDGGRLDLLLDAAGAAGDPWITELPGSYAAGTAGEIIGGFSADLTSAISGLAGTSTVTVISTVDGGDASLKQFATWEAVFTLSGAPGLTDYENVIFAVKDSPAQADSESVLYVDTATGLKYIGGAAASAADAGSLTIDSDTAFTVYVSAAEVASKIAASVSGTKDWYLKGIETDGDPDEAIPIAEGTWRVEKGGIRAIS
jgi:hypothetical protein